MNKEDERKLEELAERIALEDFEHPSEHYTFSEDYQKRKQALLKQVKKATTKKQMAPIKKYFLAAAVLFLIVPGTVFAASEIFQWLVQKENYQVSLSVNDVIPADNGKYYQLDLSYLPETMVSNQNNPNKYSYESNLNHGGFSFVLWKINSKADFEVLSAKDYQEMSFNGHDAVVITREPAHFDRQVFVLFEDLGYVLQTFVGQDVSQEDFDTFFNHISLTETAKENALDATDFDNFKQVELEDNLPVIGLPVDSKNIYQIGDTVELKDKIVENDAFNFTVNQVELLDSINAFDAADFNFDLEEFQKQDILNEQGNLIPFDQSIIKVGDGKTSLDEVVDIQEMTAKFVLVTATIKNLTNQPINDLYLQNPPMMLEKENGVYLPTKDIKEPSTRTLEIDYLDEHGEGKSYYCLPTIAGNETQIVHFGFFVDEDQLSKMFLPVFNYGGSDDLNRDDLSFIDIRQ